MTCSASAGPTPFNRCVVLLISLASACGPLNISGGRHSAANPALGAEDDDQDVEDEQSQINDAISAGIADLEKQWR